MMALSVTFDFFILKPFECYRSSERVNSTNVLRKPETGVMALYQLIRACANYYNHDEQDNSKESPQMWIKWSLWL